jgi:serine/threonine protein kinase
METVVDSPASYDQFFEEFCAELEAERAPDLHSVWLRYDGPRPRELLLEMVEQEILHRVFKKGQAIRPEEYATKCPELSASELQELLAKAQEYERRRLEVYLLQTTGEDAGTDEGQPRLAGFVDWQLISSGAMGRVWSARSVRLQRRVAVKVGHAPVLDAGSRKRVLREAQAAANCKHRSLCTIHDVVEYGDQVLIVMEYVNGRTLQQWVSQPQPPTHRDLAQKMALVARAIHVLHDTGYVHRDIKPDNVLIEDGPEGRPVVIDFGLAKHLADSAGDPQHYAAVKGTPAFMAPEQAAGRTVDISPSTDVYALGATLYALLAGRPPFVSDTVPEVLKGIIEDAPAFPARLRKTIHGDLQAICLLAMAKSPADRYASAELLARDLESFSRGEPVTAQPPTRTKRLRLWVKRNTVKLSAFATALLLLLLVGNYLLRVWQDGVRQRLVDRLDELLASDGLTDAQKDETESYLAQLTHRDPGRGTDYYERFIDKLLQMERARPSGALDPNDLSRLHRSAERLSRSSSRRLPFAEQRARLDRFRGLTTPYLHSGSLYAFIAPRPGRIDDLTNVVRIEQLLLPGAYPVGAETELLRAYLTENRLSDAYELCNGILALEGLAPLWRIVVLRDYAWLAIQSGNQDWQVHALSRVDECLAANRPVDAAYLSLLVERARLLAVNNFNEAEDVLDRYFSGDVQEQLGLRFDLEKSIVTTTGETLPNNVPVLCFQDAALLRGHLMYQGGKEQAARRAWEEGFERTRGKSTGANYEAAMLGSLCGKLTRDDVDLMLSETMKGQMIQESSPIIQQITTLLGAKILYPVWRPTIIGVLNNAWRSNHGQEYARRIALRQIPFREYVTAQLRLWLFEIFRLIITTPGRAGGALTGDEDELLWQSSGDLLVAYVNGQVTEDTLLRVVRFGAEGRPIDDWRSCKDVLPAQSRGPAAYLLARYYKRYPERLQDSRRLFEDAQQEANRLPAESRRRVLLLRLLYDSDG